MKYEKVSTACAAPIYSSDSAAHVCPQCGGSVENDVVAAGMVFCSQRCRLAYKQVHGDAETEWIRRRIIDGPDADPGVMWQPARGDGLRMPAKWKRSPTEHEGAAMYRADKINGWKYGGQFTHHPVSRADRAHSLATGEPVYRGQVVRSVTVENGQRVVRQYRQVREVYPNRGPWRRIGDVVEVSRD